MHFIAMAFGLFVAILGALGVASPTTLLGLLQRLQSKRGLYGIAAIRLAFGVVYFIVAPETRAPQLIRAFGVIVVISGIITPFFGVTRFKRLTDWWIGVGSGFTRAWCGVVIALGLSLAYAVAP